MTRRTHCAAYHFTCAFQTLWTNVNDHHQPNVRKTCPILHLTVRLSSVNLLSLLPFLHLWLREVGNLRHARWLLVGVGTGNVGSPQLYPVNQKIFIVLFHGCVKPGNYSCKILLSWVIRGKYSHKQFNPTKITSHKSFLVETYILKISQCKECLNRHCKVALLWSIVAMVTTPLKELKGAINFWSILPLWQLLSLQLVVPIGKKYLHGIPTMQNAS